MNDVFDIIVQMAGVLLLASACLLVSTGCLFGVYMIYRTVKDDK